MSAQIKERDESHSEQQAKAQFESIIEMVAALTREGAADIYVKDLTREECVKLLTDNELDYDQENDSDEDLREAVAEFITDETIDPDDFEFDEDGARQTIQEDPLSVQVRGDWGDPGSDDLATPVEFEILLCTGGPAVRIIGDLDRGSPSRPRIQHQDWGTPWTEYFPANGSEALQTYCEQFYYGD